MIKQRETNSWKSVSYAKSITGAQTYTKFPIVLRTTEQSISTWSVKGNTETSGTPSPSNPVEVNGVGVRTENLFNINAWVSSITGVSGQGSFSYSNGVLSVTSNNSADAYTTPFGASSSGVYKVPVKPNTKYTFGLDIGNNGHFMMFENGLTTSGYIHYNVVNGSSFTTQSDTTFMTFRYGTRTEQALGTTVTIRNIMLVEGETAPSSYIPFGYKIPITNGGMTTNIYLGSTQSTRQIKKLVLTGGADETWNNAGDGTMYRSDISDYLREAIVTSVCTHYPCNANVPSSTAAQYGVSFITSSSYNRLYIKDTSYSTATDFKNWLSTEYANGTPVTVWYVLATPNTATVNEPLMKIGTYADTLSNAASIPTTSGLNTIDVDTTVKPSEMSLTYDGYKICKHKRKSANLFDGTMTQGGIYDIGIINFMTTRVRTQVLVTAGKKYTISSNMRIRTVYGYNGDYTDSDNRVELIGSLNKPQTWTFTAPEGVTNVGIAFCKADDSDILPSEIKDVMINEGQTALPYAPYWK